jgi:methylmalonyl-CoA carboxyltransferase large subunit
MSTEPVNWADVIATLNALRQEVARLSERIAALETADPGDRMARWQGDSVIKDTPPPSTTLSPGQPAAAPLGEGLSEELLLVISAAVAAFLGKKPHIRQIRLVGATAWAQQGRVTIQASHALSAGHARSPQ